MLFFLGGFASSLLPVGVFWIFKRFRQAVCDSFDG